MFGCLNAEPEGKELMDYKQKQQIHYDHFFILTCFTEFKVLVNNYIQLNTIITAPVVILILFCMPIASGQPTYFRAI